MGEVLLLLAVALTVAAVVFGVTVLVSGRDPGLAPAERDGRAVPLPGSRPLREADVAEVRFDTAVRGYRMAQVDQAMRRTAYDIGYKSELIGVLEAEVAALREGRTAEADALRRAREESAGTGTGMAVPPVADEPPTADESPAVDDSAAVQHSAAEDTSAVDGSAAPESVPATAPATGLSRDGEVVALRPPTDPTAPTEPDDALTPPTAAAPGPDVTGPERVDAGADAPGADAPGADDGERDRGPVVRSESA
ncbi:DivIVA domain-containing protein [Micromonospora sp. R77]|uniref:DivIVA domain-containing protein n=1 Tax=Micromonospora sp. R77 TaxID=2925836 RepID=UPI001F6221AB|nr:DivIVA domain-containing protein [Micromonospora sp. R77]MCI4064096.1 DivIVA domain-containing protein [Micromonospora sp. R77]